MGTRRSSVARTFSRVSGFEKCQTVIQRTIAQLLKQTLTIITNNILVIVSSFYKVLPSENLD